MKSKVFKGLTKPVMFLGVPINILISTILLFAVLGIILSMFSIFGYFLIFLVIPAILIERNITKKDDYEFKLLHLSTKTRSNSLTKKTFNTNNSFISNNYSELNKASKRELKMNLDFFNLTPYSTFLPYSSQIDESIIITKDGYLISTWKVAGIPYLTNENEDLKRKNDFFERMMRSFTESPISFYKHTIREDDNNELNSDFKNNEFLEKIDTLYKESFKKTSFKKNVYYFSIVYDPHENKISKNKFQNISKKDYQEWFKIHLEEMKNLILSISSFLKEFNGVLLKTYKKNDFVFSEQQQFYNFLITNKWENIKITSTPIFNRLGNVNIHFNKNIGEIEKGSENKYFKCLEIKDFENELEIGFLNGLLSSNADFVLTQSFVLCGKKKALSLLKLQSNKLNSAETEGITELEEIEDAKDDLISGNLTFGYYHFVLFVYGDSVDDVQKKTKEVNSILSNLGIISIESTVALESSFLSQFPSNFQYRPRIPLISSKNFSHLCSFHNLTTGKAYNNAWGDAVTVLKTTSGQAYYFNYHVSTGIDSNDLDKKLVGHTLVLGSSGTGKTVLMNFLFNQSRKFASKNSFNSNTSKKLYSSIFFDKDLGAMANILACGGVYLRIKAGVPSGFAPFKCENTEKNKTFLIELISLLVTKNNKSITTKDELDITHAVNAVMSLPLENRGNGITKIISNIPIGKSEEEIKNSLQMRLSIWAGNGSYAWVFDNDDDLLNIESNQIIGIDGTEFLDNETICAPITRYLIQKIYSLLDGRRGQLCIDETWKYVENSIMATAMNNLLVTARKSDWFVVMGTQSPSQIINSSFATAIIEQTETYILLPNEKAKKEDYLKIGLTEKEFNLVKTINPVSRQFLIKKSNGTAICELNLNKLGSYLKILSTSKSDVEKLEDLYSLNNKNWINSYLKF